MGRCKFLFPVFRRHQAHYVHHKYHRGIEPSVPESYETKSVFPSDTALEKMLYLASENVVKKWTQRYRNWDQVLNQLIVLYGERLTQLSVKGKEPTTATTGTISFWPSLPRWGDRAVYPGWGRKPDQHILPEQYDPATDDGAGYGYTYDAEDPADPVTGPSGEVVAAYVYDRMGNCIERKDALGGCHYYAYELRGKRIRELHPLGEGGQPQEARGPQPYQRTDYRYDKNGNRIQEIRYGGSYTKEGGSSYRQERT